MREPVRMTEAEWQKLTAERECATRGHSFIHIVGPDGEPVQLLCDCCGRAWPVGEAA